MRSYLIAAFAFATALISTSASAKDSSPFVLIANSGVGPTLGVVGAGVEVGYRPTGRFGISVEGGAGYMVGFGGHIWFPGEKLQLGLGLAEALSWSQVLPEPSGCGPNSHDSDGINVFFGPDIALDHDIGAAGGWALRYGAAGGFVGVGCAASIIAMPTVSARYVW